MWESAVGFTDHTAGRTIAERVSEKKLSYFCFLSFGSLDDFSIKGSGHALSNIGYTTDKILSQLDAYPGRVASKNTRVLR